MSHPLIILYHSAQFRRLFDEGKAVFIGRGSIWGNPFKIGKDGSREDVVKKHLNWVPTQIELLRRISELEGMYLGCFCSPKLCHGENLIHLTENPALVRRLIKLQERKFNV